MSRAAGRRRPLAAAGRAGDAGRALGRAPEQARSAEPRRSTAPAACCAKAAASSSKSASNSGAARGRRRAARGGRRGRRRQPPLPDGHRRGASRPSCAAIGARRPGRRRHRGARPDRPGGRLPQRRRGLRGRRSAERRRSARTSFALDGSGVTVGILSDSFDRAATAISGGPIATHAHEDVLDGDLPGTGNPCGNADAGRRPRRLPAGEGADEGRAMAQIVHDLAPGAEIDFATAFTGEARLRRTTSGPRRPRAPR